MNLSNAQSRRAGSDTLYSSHAGDRYTGLDRFGRADDQFWTNPNTPSSPTEREQYGYDRNSNALYRNNLVSSSFSELYHANSASSGDNNTAYDNLNRITSFRRGTLTSSGNNGSGLDQITTANLNSTSGVPNTNSWTLDSVGNSTNTGGTSRGVNAQNEFTSISGMTTPTYDSNGNMTKDQNGVAYTFDAWNRAATANKSSTLSETFAYDATGRRPGVTNNLCCGTTTSSYYSKDWQVIEDDTPPVGGCGSTTYSTYTFGPDYIDNVIERDQKVGISGAVARVYAQARNSKGSQVFSASSEKF